MNHTDNPNFDFASAAREIGSLGKNRGESRVFADATCALYFKLKQEEVSVSFLYACLGDPDAIEIRPSGEEILEYKWIGFQSIQSSTKFIALNGKIVGVEPQRAA